MPFLRTSLALTVGAGLAAALLIVPAQAAPADAEQPNVVFVLVDDLSENLLPYLSEVQAMAADGVTFANYFNATPWCCPSRATVQSGKYPHNTQVRSNGYPAGGFGQFFQNDMDSSIGVQMQASGYRTGLMGKYMNGYRVAGSSNPDSPPYPPNFVPPGWDSWFSGSGYQHFRYKVVESVDGAPPQRLAWKGQHEANYYTDVLSDRADAFLRTESAEPFFLLLAPYAPHGGLNGDPENGIRYPPAPRDRADSPSRPAAWGEPEFVTGDCGPVACADVPWPDTSTPGNFNLVQEAPLAWMATEPLTETKLAKGRKFHVQRIQMIQSVNDLLVDLRQTLAETGQADNTWIMFTSDNGYHLGEHALFGGKTTAYDHDIKTPLVVLPPGGTGAPLTVDALVQNTDVLPTLLEIAGGVVPPDVDGLSLLPLVADPLLPWRNSVLLELTNDSGDSEGRYFNPDTVGYEGDHVAPSYNALRTVDHLYVDYSVMDGLPPADFEAEFYDLATDPYQMQNLYPALTADQRLFLNTRLLLQTSCVGPQCALAQGIEPAPTPTPTEEPTESRPPTETETPTPSPTSTETPS